MKVQKFLIAFSILVFISSCNRQKNTHTSQAPLNSPVSSYPIGDTVSQMDDNLKVIFHDSQNNYWFGSKGVFKYDGKNITHYTQKDGLCSDAIIGIQEDHLGNIYFDTQDGVSKFDGTKFTTLAVIDKPKSEQEWKLDPNDLWFRMGWDKSGPYRYDGKVLHYLEFPKTDQVNVFNLKYPMSSYNPYGIYSSYTDRKGSIWFGTASLGLCRYDGKSVRWLYDKQLTSTPSGGDFGIRSMIEDKDENFWFCNPLYRYEILPDLLDTNQINYRKKKGLHPSNKNKEKHIPYFMSMTKDDEGVIWAVTYDEGVWRNDGKTLTHFPVKNGDTTVLLFSIYTDRQGILWLGTHHNGVYKFNGETFERFNPNIR